MQQDLQEPQRRAHHIEELLQKATSFSDPEVRATAEELIQELLSLYGEGLERIIGLTEHAECAGNALIASYANDELVGPLLILHGLHPVDIETRIILALDKIHADLKAQGASARLLKVEEARAYVRLEEHGQNCAATTTTLKQSLENAIYEAAPDLNELHIENSTEPRRTSVPVKFMPRRRTEKNVSQRR